MNYPPTITRELIAGMSPEVFPGQIVVVDRPEEVKKALVCLEASGLVGFDTETRPNFSKKDSHKVCLIQVSTDRICYLFRLNRLGGVPAKLKGFLENGQITKIGLSLLDDFHALRKLSPIDPDGFIDLQKFVLPFGIQESSLRKIYAILFGRKISKRAQLSNWEADTLTASMQRYAALDAWACLRIYQRLTLHP
ncbi:MAG: 3'-5' exonuclease domain-containing protein 2 [Tannerella sp.]|jgi:ribonuclease D|nr:3'-5' exonuclease domain-containing protein 2 [Tannerella sp.]